MTLTSALNVVQRPRPASHQLPADLPPILQRLYSARGLVQAEELELGLERLLPPSGLKGIDAAATLLAHAIAAQQHIVIAADYDADGATACALAVLGLRALGATQVSFVVPDRFRMGYGLSPGLADAAHTLGAQLLVTVDNGIASVEGVAHAQALGMQVLITDHHLPGPQLPTADACVNPNQPGCSFASKHLAGVGVMFYVLLALRALLKKQGAYASQPAPNLAEFLDLVALGSVADVVRLDYNNRILVEHGLRRIRAGRARPGIAALLQVAGRAAASVSSTDLGFVVGPRLNAAGRLEDMAQGIQCLLAPSLDAALPLAKTLDELNRQRRQLQTQMSEQALDLTAGSGDYGVCAFNAEWHEGIVGLVASKLKEAHHRPSIAFAPSEDPTLLKGSARSVEGFHVRDALALVDARHPGLIARFGGHAMAAGLTLMASRYPEFAAAFNLACQQTLAAECLHKTLETDGPLLPQEFSLATAQLLETAQPWGQGFPAPLFEGEFTVVGLRLMGSEQQHVRYTLKGGAGEGGQAVHFGGGSDAVAPGGRVTVLYTLGINRYQGSESVQLMVQHLVPLSAR